MPFIMLLLLGVGISIYFRQRFSFGNYTVVGQRARRLGCLLMLPLPLSFVLLMCWLTPLVSEYGSAEALQQAILTDSSISGTSALIELISILGCVGLATWLIFSGRSGGTLSETGSIPHQAMTLRQAASYSHLTENQLMMLIRANALVVDQAVDGYRIDPKVLRLWMYMERGVAQYNRHAFVEAIQDFTRALDINHKEARAYAWRGLSFFRAGRESDGLQDIRYALAHTHNSEERHQLTQWLNAPNTIPHQITGRNPIIDRVVTDWLAGVDTVEREANTGMVGGSEPATSTSETPRIALPEEDNETLRS